MPLSKVTSVSVIPWIDKNNGNVERRAFRFTYEEIVPNPKVAFMMRFEDRLQPRYITLFFNNRNKKLDEQLEFEAMMNSYVDAGMDSFMPEFVMAYEQEVLPYCRAYTQNNKNHLIGDLIKNANGTPKLYDTITIHCKSKLNELGIEVPINPSNVRYQAEQQRNWFINNDDKNGIRRFFEPSAVMNYEAVTAPDDDSTDMPIDAIIPQNKPKFDPNTGMPIA